MRLALFGAAPDTPNMGVSALFKSVVNSFGNLIDNIEFVVFDNGLGERTSQLITSSGKKIPLILYGARSGHRYYRPENLVSMLILSKMGKVGAVLNRGLQLIDSCDAVLDISGGDSFSDIYGLKRFYQVNRSKQIVINRNIPLILLPQTYGPYKEAVVYQKACESVKRASIALARDENSFGILKSMLGDRFDSEKHLSTVDMAFLLEKENADSIIDDELSAWLSCDREKSPLIGLNISGLIYNDPYAAIEQYGFRADYRETVAGIVSKILEETQARIILISHVMDFPGHYESDYEACMDVYNKLDESQKNRVIIAPNNLNESQVKWLISKLDWFCGTRMHSTIASLSTNVPTATISYSDKALGVFKTCNQGHQVFDPRILNRKDIIKQLLLSFLNRESTYIDLKDSINDYSYKFLTTIIRKIQSKSY